MWLRLWHFVGIDMDAPWEDTLRGDLGGGVAQDAPRGGDDLPLDRYAKCYHDGDVSTTRSLFLLTGGISNVAQSPVVQLLNVWIGKKQRLAGFLLCPSQLSRAVHGCNLSNCRLLLLTSS